MNQSINLTILGDIPDPYKAPGNSLFLPAVIFPNTGILVAFYLPTHAAQYLAYEAFLNKRRREEGKPPMSEFQRNAAWSHGVDLFINTDQVQIRPDRNRMVKAFDASGLLEERYSKCDIRFLFAGDTKVRQAIRERGELWRISHPPRSPEEIVKAIEDSRSTLAGGVNYYYCRIKGTRWLTYQEFANLGTHSTEKLRECLIEIRDFSARKNKGRRPEVAFAAADSTFSRDDLAGKDFEKTDESALRAWHAEATAKFRRAVADPAYLHDDPKNPAWRKHMFNLVTDRLGQSTVDEADVLEGIPGEFFRQIYFLPGGHIKHGEFLFDTVFDEFEKDPDDEVLQGLCNETIKGIIHNCIREFGSLEYINIGRLAHAMRKRKRAEGHRAYIVELKHRREPSPVVRMIRLQQYGVEQYLDGGADLLTAVMRAQDYTEYIMDRRLGCWELGLPVPERFDAKIVFHTYRGSNAKFRGTRIWTTYYERDFVYGSATDKIPKAQFQDADFAAYFAMLLGHVAASNLVVGRTTDAMKPIFDEGDEVLVFDAEKNPEQILVADHVGTFADYTSGLDTFAMAYARPINDRMSLVPDPAMFADTYVNSLVHRLEQLQREYRQNQRTFDGLFKHCRAGKGTFRDRWEKVLGRMDRTDARHLGKCIRDAIRA